MMALAKLASKCQSCPHQLACDHKEMEEVGFLPIPEDGLNNPDLNITVGMDLASGPDMSTEVTIGFVDAVNSVGNIYPVAMEELKRTMDQIAKGVDMESWEREIDAVRFLPELVDIWVKHLMIGCEEACRIMERLYAEAARFCESIEPIVGAIRDLVEKDISIEERVDYISEKAYDFDIDLSPRQYGERLSWGKQGRPYKSSYYSYVAVFKRNLPYQRRNYPL